MAWVGLPDALLSAMVFDLSVDLIGGGEAWAAATKFFQGRKFKKNQKKYIYIYMIAGLGPGAPPKGRVQGGGPDAANEPEKVLSKTPAATSLEA